MRVSADLAGWFDDAARRREGRARTAREAEAFAALPDVTRFRERLVAAGGDAAAIEAAARSLFKHEGWVGATIAALIRVARGDPFAIPPFRAIAGLQDALLLFDTPQISMSLGVIRPEALAEAKRAGGARSIRFTGRRRLLKFVRAGRARIALWRASEVGADFRAMDCPPCQTAGELDISDGEIVAIDGRYESYAIVHVAAPIVLLQAEIKAGAAIVAREYDAATRALIGCSGGADSHSRAEIMLSWLRQARHPGAAPAFEACIADAPFFVRWHAMREFLAYDRDAALPALRGLAERDPHGEVRAAAAATLARLEGQSCRA